MTGIAVKRRPIGKVAALQSRNKLRERQFGLVLAALPMHAAAAPQVEPATITTENGCSAAGFTIHLHANGTMTKQGFVLLDGLGVHHHQQMRHLAPTAFDKAAAVIAALGQPAAVPADQQMTDCFADGYVHISADPAIAGFATLISSACVNENVNALYIGIVNTTSIGDLADVAFP